MFGKRIVPEEHTIQLQCGLCLREGKETKLRSMYTLERMQAMIRHWHHAHGDSIVPVFDQNTWRTGIVYPLDYTPKCAR